MESNYTILIADDDCELRELLRDELSFTHATILEVQDGRQAKEHAFKGNIDVALLDVRMPHANGVEVLEAFREESADTVCVMITGSGDPKTIKDCLQAGAYDFIVKPYSPTELAATVRRALEKAFFQRERRAFLEFMVCEITRTSIQDFRSLPPRKQYELFKYAKGVVSMRISNRAAGEST